MKRILIAGAMPGGIALETGRAFERLHTPGSVDTVYTIERPAVRKLLAGVTDESMLAHLEHVRIHEFDASVPESLDALIQALHGQVFDHFVHAIAYSPPKTTLGTDWYHAPPVDILTGYTVSTVSFVQMCTRLIETELLKPGASVLNYVYDPTHVSPSYGWMTPHKAGLVAATRSLAHTFGPTHGIRFNTIASGPLPTMSGKAIPGYNLIGDPWSDLAPLGWDADAALKMVGEASARVIQIPGMSGEIIHIDGGAHFVRFANPK